MRVSDILQRKGHAVSQASPDVPLRSLVKRLRLERIGALLICESDGTIIGLLSERDIVEGLAEHGTELLGMPASAVMRPAPITCSTADDVKTVMALMTRHRVRHLPVLDNGALAGLISIGDVVKHRLDTLEAETNVMRDVYLAAR